MIKLDKTPQRRERTEKSENQFDNLQIKQIKDWLLRLSLIVGILSTSTQNSGCDSKAYEVSNVPGPIDCPPEGPNITNFVNIANNPNIEISDEELYKMTLQFQKDILCIYKTAKEEQPNLQSGETSYRMKFNGQTEEMNYLECWEYEMDEWINFGCEAWSDNHGFYFEANPDQYNQEDPFQRNYSFYTHYQITHAGADIWQENTGYTVYQDANGPDSRYSLYCNNNEEECRRDFEEIENSSIEIAKTYMKID